MAAIGWAAVLPAAIRFVVHSTLFTSSCLVLQANPVRPVGPQMRGSPASSCPYFHPPTASHSCGQMSVSLSPASRRRQRNYRIVADDTWETCRRRRQRRCTSAQSRDCSRSRFQVLRLRRLHTTDCLHGRYQARQAPPTAMRWVAVADGAIVAWCCHAVGGMHGEDHQAVVLSYHALHWTWTW
jgi:hypothetical protein